MKERLCKTLCGEVQIHQTRQGFLQIRTPFTFTDSLGAGILQFGQGLTRIYDLTFLNRARVASTFYEDLKERLYSLVAPEKIQPDHVVAGETDAESYPIDFRVEGKRAPLFVFGVAGRDKARLVTIVLEHWLRAKIDFDSLLIFQDPRKTFTGRSSNWPRDGHDCQSSNSELRTFGCKLRTFGGGLRTFDSELRTLDVSTKGITYLIVSSPYDEPKHHWRYHRESREA